MPILYVRILYLLLCAQEHFRGHALRFSQPWKTANMKIGPEKKLRMSQISVERKELLSPTLVPSRNLIFVFSTYQESKE